MADAIHIPPEKRFLNTPSARVMVSDRVLIRSRVLSYMTSVLVLQIFSD